MGGRRGSWRGIKKEKKREKEDKKRGNTSKFNSGPFLGSGISFAMPVLKILQ